MPIFLKSVLGKLMQSVFGVLSDEKMFGRGLHIAGLFFVLVAGLAAYRGAFSGFFVQDDYGWLRDARFTSFRDYLQCFFRFNPALSYRPLSQETFFWLGQRLFGLWPPGFHFFSVAFHLLGSCLLYILIRRFFSPLPSLVGAFFYTTHAAHFRSVYWISAFPEPSALVCYLGALLLFVRFDRQSSRWAHVLSVLTMGLGLMCKESILTVPLVLAVYCLLVARSRLWWTAPFFALSGIYAVCRLTSSAVRAAPYPLNFGLGAWQNLLNYFAWAAGFTESFLKLKLKWNVESSHGIVAAGFTLAIIGLIVAARNKRLALFGLVWFVLALQPVLYFWKHIDPYYLAPALAALSFLIASAFPPMLSIRDWKSLVAALGAAWLCIWFSLSSVRREGRWWTERTFVGRNILSKMPEVDAVVPEGKMAYVFGFTPWEYGVMQSDSAFKLFGFSPNKYLLMGLDPRRPGQIRTLQGNGGLGEYYCFVFARGEFFDMTSEFHKNPEHFLIPVALEVTSKDVRRGRDMLLLHTVNFPVPAIDIRYSLNEKQMPDCLNHRLDKDYWARFRIEDIAKAGTLRFLAMRDSRNPAESGWFPLDLQLTIR